jgi:cytochrome c553
MPRGRFRLAACAAATMLSWVPAIGADQTVPAARGAAPAVTQPAATAAGAPPATTTPSTTPAGATTAAATAKADVCVACHGPNGNSTMPASPSLAGQPKQFITTQLVMFREGRRTNPQMSPFAANLTNADINELGTYFAAQAIATTAETPPPNTLTDGARLVAKYNCIQCHGPTLKGVQHIPRLAGQHAEYLRAQLRGFKTATRFDMDGNMTSAAQPLTDADIEVLAAFLAAMK